ncbi:hypothetical protein T05_16186 [Trichinella murrelli]|uniref:Uncharacterized protein n=1 Tax=Trichinella murrelli TaxID=144512 RepID=A0A0V0SUI3_9BILA|nr:hypothetical protein T05_16186 [Trichinella murrelli]
MREEIVGVAESDMQGERIKLGIVTATHTWDSEMRDL